MAPKNKQLESFSRQLEEAIADGRVSLQGVGGIMSGSGSILPNTTVTAEGDWQISQQLGDYEPVLYQGLLNGLIPASILRLNHPVHGNGAVGIIDGSLLPPAAELMAICGVNNLADNEEAYHRAVWQGSINTWLASVNANARDGNNANIFIQSASIDGSADLAAHAQSSGSGAAQLELQSIGVGTGEAILDIISSSATAAAEVNITVLGATTNNLNLDGIPEYANDGAADADANLNSNSLYKLTGDRTVYQKP